MPPLKQRQLETRTASEESTPELLEEPNNDSSCSELADAKASIVSLENICHRFLMERELREREVRKRENAAWTTERANLCHSG